MHHRFRFPGLHRAQSTIIIISIFFLLQMFFNYDDNKQPYHNEEIGLYNQQYQDKPTETTRYEKVYSKNIKDNTNDKLDQNNLKNYETIERDYDVRTNLINSIKKAKEKIRESKLTSSKNSFNIKPLVNMTINALGLFDDIDTSEPVDPSDTKRVLHSMFQIWNPQASNWATKVSKEFKKSMQDGREAGDEGSVDDDVDLVETSVRVEECGCDRLIQAHPEKLWRVNDSTCSSASYWRGAGQKIISFSFYGSPNSTKGKERKYFQGIEDNLRLLPRHYPGWTIRVYYDLEQEDPVLTSLCELTCANPNIDICHVRNNPASGDISKIFAMNWRFFPALDPQVDILASRDLDSRINSRERAAVDDWMKTKKHFHFMRDNPAHGIEILGSGWSVRLGPGDSLVREMFKQSFKQASRDSMFWAERQAYGPDQGFLKRYIWPWAKWSAVSHDSYFCHHFPRTSPFPTRRKNSTNNFVAAIVGAGDYLITPCPEACRPKLHKDWETC